MFLKKNPYFPIGRRGKTLMKNSLDLVFEQTVEGHDEAKIELNPGKKMRCWESLIERMVSDCSYQEFMAEAAFRLAQDLEGTGGIFVEVDDPSYGAWVENFCGPRQPYMGTKEQWSGPLREHSDSHLLVLPWCYEGNPQGIWMVDRIEPFTESEIDGVRECLEVTSPLFYIRKHIEQSTAA
ncbi:MAG: hypothetical protein CL678_13750 [Bdellovibrionaceae bacterium]|nr:hypothetical protein [Pseudobdellovibrionaceae bacterium]